MARILGLDLGSYSLKAVLLETNLRGSALRKWVEVPRLEGDKAQTLASALTALNAGALHADQVIVSVPGLHFATHTFALPFTDPKRIDATLPFEVEGQLPFDISEAVFDYQVASADEKSSQLLVGVVKKAELETLLAALKEAKLEPRIVTHPGLAYQNLIAALPSKMLPETANAPIAFLDIGHERTTLAIGRPNGNIEFTRTIAGGGLSLSKALAAEFKVSLAEATDWKNKHAALGREVVGPDAERAAQAMLRALHPILRELRPTLKAYTARSRLSLEHILLCGGTATMPGIAEQLERDLNIPVFKLDLPPDVDDAIPREACAPAAQAYSLALRGQASGAKAPRFNLRRGEFAFKGDLDFVREKLPQLGIFAAVLFVLLIVSGVVRNGVLERREKQLDAVLCETTQRVLGKCVKDYGVALNMLKGKESPAAGLPKRSAVNLLAEATSRISPDLKVVLDRIVIDLDRISIRGEAPSSKEIDDLTTALKKFKCFTEIKVGKIEKSKDGNKINFGLDVQVQCPDAVAQAGS
ncbi:MAG: pilus assembly protein PilM [Myxococcaceae bacterium]|nr:pilus assembly protein PilM [Myxococcaceae bacterium]